MWLQPPSLVIHTLHAGHCLALCSVSQSCVRSSTLSGAGTGSFSSIGGSMLSWFTRLSRSSSVLQRGQVGCRERLANQVAKQPWHVLWPQGSMVVAASASKQTGQALSGSMVLCRTTGGGSAEPHGGVHLMVATGGTLLSESSAVGSAESIVLCRTTGGGKAEPHGGVHLTLFVAPTIDVVSVRRFQRMVL